jgi:nucleotide-binding universal stress UspA family protein
VHIVHVGPLYAGFTEFEPAFEIEAREVLDEAPLDALAGIEVEKHLVHGHSPAEGLHRAVAACDARLVVLGSSHHGTLGRVVAGSVAGHLLHGSPCAVAVAPRGYADDPHGSFRTIAVAYDGSREARAAAARAGDLALRSEATLRVISVATPPDFGWAGAGVVYPLRPETADDRLERTRNGLEELLEALPSPTRADGRVLHGQPAPQIVDECEKGVDLLVMGSRGYGTIGRVLLGSVSSAVIRHAPCPVLVLPQAAVAPEPAELESHGASATS